MEAWEGLPGGLKAEAGSPQCFLCEGAQQLVVPQQIRGQHKIFLLEKKVGGGGGLGLMSGRVLPTSLCCAVIARHACCCSRATPARPLFLPCVIHPPPDSHTAAQRDSTAGAHASLLPLHCPCATPPAPHLFTRSCTRWLCWGSNQHPTAKDSDGWPGDPLRPPMAWCRRRSAAGVRVGRG